MSVREVVADVTAITFFVVGGLFFLVFREQKLYH